MITTLDNPYNPFDSFDKWYSFDTSNGYNTCELLARLSPDSYADTAMLMYDVYVSEAEKLVLDMNPTGNYVKITREAAIDKGLY